MMGDIFDPELYFGDKNEDLRDAYRERIRKEEVVGETRPHIFYDRRGHPVRQYWLKTGDDRFRSTRIKQVAKVKDEMERNELLDLVRGCKNCSIQPSSRAVREYKYLSPEAKKRVRDALRKERGY
jgi:hypothetical protein